MTRAPSPQNVGLVHPYQSPSRPFLLTNPDDDESFIPPKLYCPSGVLGNTGNAKTKTKDRPNKSLAISKTHNAGKRRKKMKTSGSPPLGLELRSAYDVVETNGVIDGCSNMRIR